MNVTSSVDPYRFTPYRTPATPNGPTPDARQQQAQASPPAAHTGTDTGKSKGDSVTLSDTARKLAKTAEASGSQTDSDTSPGAFMTALTDTGTQVTVEAKALERTTFTMGGQLARKGAFTLAGKADNSPLEMAFSVTFEHASGTRQTFDLTGNAVFREAADGTIIKDATQGEGSKTLQGSDGNEIFIAIEDGTEVLTGNGNNRVFNLARDSRIMGGAGNDLVASLGDGARIETGEGHDAVVLLRDTLRPAPSQALDDSMADDPEKRMADHRTPGAQTVHVDTGDGDNEVIANVDLYKGSIRTGAGADNVTLRDATSLRVNLGAGNDTFSGDNLFHSQLDAGAGDDNLAARSLRGGGLSAGEGHDTMTLGLVFDAFVDGGSGDDVIDIGKAKSSFISGGSGNDAITVDMLIDSSLDGGEGDDIIMVGSAANSRITGGNGRDVVMASSLTADPEIPDTVERAMAARSARGDAPEPDARLLVAVGPGDARRVVSGTT